MVEEAKTLDKADHDFLKLEQKNYHQVVFLGCWQLSVLGQLLAVEYVQVSVRTCNYRMLSQYILQKMNVKLLSVDLIGDCFAKTNYCGTLLYRQPLIAGNFVCSTQNT